MYLYFNATTGETLLLYLVTFKQIWYHGQVSSRDIKQMSGRCPYVSTRFRIKMTYFDQFESKVRTYGA